MNLEPHAPGSLNPRISVASCLEAIWRDLRISVRSLRRSPGFSAAVITTLALCVGANAAIFSALYVYILKPLPFYDSGQLVEVYNSTPKAGQARRLTSVAQYLDYKEHADLFDGIALWQVWPFIMGEESGSPERNGGARVSADLFELLGLQPIIGRFYTLEESVPGKDLVVVLTQSFWESHYGADPGVLDKTIRLSGRTYDIIGVVPRAIEKLNRDAVLFKPFQWSSNAVQPRARYWTSAQIYARLKPGATQPAALAQLDVLDRRFIESSASAEQRDFVERSGHRVVLGGVRRVQTEPVRSGLAFLQWGALLVLLLGCVNVTNLMLARANVRRTELAVRQALGAGRVAVARQMLTESVLLTTVGAAIGLVLAWSNLGLVNSNMNSVRHLLHPVGMDPTVLGITLAGAFVIAAIVGCLPVLHIWRADLAAAFQSGGSRGSSAGGGRRTTSGLLVTAQVSLAFVLLVGACLLLTSFARVLRVDLGFDPTNLTSARLQYTADFPDMPSRQRVLDRLLEAMRTIPGVTSVSAASQMPMNGQFGTSTFPIPGSALAQDESHPSATVLAVSPGFFDTLGIRIVEGRAFTEADTRDSQIVYVVDREFAERYFPGRSAVGQRIGLALANQAPESGPVIVGVAENAELHGPGDSDGPPFVYNSLNQSSWAAHTFLVRGPRPFADMISLMRERAREVEPRLPLYLYGTMEKSVAGTLAHRRGIMVMLSGFSAIALLLAAVGIYGMLAYDVTQRTREIGIRGAIGASRSQIVGLILKQGLRKAGVGLGIGLIGALFLTRTMSSLLFEVEPTDPLTFAGVFLLLLGISCLASWLPARRAAKIDPIIALRAE